MRHDDLRERPRIVEARVGERAVLETDQRVDLERDDDVRRRRHPDDHEDGDTDDDDTM